MSCTGAMIEEKTWTESMFTAPGFFSGLNILHQCYSVGGVRPEYAVTDLSVCALLSPPSFPFAVI